jgi:hypothetical protein
VDHPEEVIRVPFPARDNAAEVMKPGEEPLNLPTASAAPKRPAILRTGVAVGSMGRDQLDAIGGGQVVIEAVAIDPLSPINRVGSSRRNRAASVASTRVTSCGEALATWMARGRPWPSPIAMILLPLPRRVGPTAEPLFSPS